MKQVSQSYIRLTLPKFEISRPLEPGEDMIFQGKGEIISKSEHENADGTIDTISTLKPLLFEVKEDTMKVEAPLTTTGTPSSKSYSKRFRDKLYVLFQAKGHDNRGVIFDDYYAQTMERLLDSLDQRIDETTYK